MNRFGRLWTRLRSAWVRRRAARRRNRLPEVLRLHLVAALEESGRGREARANHFRIELDPVDAAALAPSAALPIELAREVAAEARRRGYALAGPVWVEIVAGPGPGIHVQARREPEAVATGQKELETTLTFRRERGRVAAGKRSAPSLVVCQGPDEGSTFTLWGDKIFVGRRATNHVILHDPGVSRVHLELRRTGDKWLLRDLKSLNGTWVNGQRVTEIELGPGDHIALGSTCLEYRGVKE